MDRLPGSNDAFTGNNLFADNNPQFNAYDPLNLFPNGSESNLGDQSWAVNPGDYPNQSRGQQSAPSWQHHMTVQPGHPGYNSHPSPYGRALSHSPAPFVQNSFASYGAQQSYQYRQPQYDPALVVPSGNGQKFDVNVAGFNSQANTPATIAPQALEPSIVGGSGYDSNGFGANGFNALPQRATPAPLPINRVLDQKALARSIPASRSVGIFQIIDFDNLAQATKSQRMGNFINIGNEAQEWDCNRSAIPSYAPRKSRNQLRALAGNNVALLSKIGRKPHKSKGPNSLPNNIRPFQPPLAAQGQQGIKYERDSSSEEDSSDDDDDDDSAYSDDDESDSPLPATRPDSPRGAVEYDTIKALWRSKRKVVDGDAIRKGLVDFWEIVKTIRDRWKADGQAVSDAEDKKRTGELPLLKSRVKDQRDMIEAAFKAAYKHGHRGIVELLAENVSLVFLCYQFLNDRAKDDDFNGSLSRAILETMSTFTTLTKEKMQKTHLVKVVPRYQKKADAKSQYWLKKILANSEEATRDLAAKVKTVSTAPSVVVASEIKPASPAGKTIRPELVTGVKRAAGPTEEGVAQKKAATSVTKAKLAGTVPKVNGTANKSISNNESSKAGSAANAAMVTRKTVVAKPSGFFSSLQSAQKKPGTSNADKVAAQKPGVGKPAATTMATSTSIKPAFSFAETMANLSKPKEERPAPKPEKALPTETPEERTKRLRKEARRKLTVTFKQDEDLVQIRYFTHDPEEETNHDASQMRDVSDVGGEGRMFKQQHQLMDMDEEEETAEVAEHLTNFKSPSLVDFAEIPQEERERAYAPYGGGHLKPDSPERAMRERYENDTLIVVYTDTSQIPPDPREPADPYSGSKSGPVTQFGLPEDHNLVARARQRRIAQVDAQRAPSSHVGGRSMDATQGMPQSGTSAAPIAPDLQQILANLRQSTAGQAATALPQQPTPAAPAYALPPFMASQAPRNPMAQAPPVAPVNLDISGILAALQNSHQQSGQTGSHIGQYGAPSTVPMAGLPPHDSHSLSQAYGVTKQADLHNPGPKVKSSLYKTKVCRFWQQGACQKGDACTYLHE